MTYDDYLQSPYWTGRKAAVIRARGYECERCGSTHSLELHHRTYARLFREHPDDLELLCLGCHAWQHGRKPKPRGQDMQPIAVAIAEELKAIAARKGADTTPLT